MEQMADLIDSGMKPLEVIKKFLKEHKRIIFNGDGYSAEWEEEAARRGLPNNKNTVDAMECLKDEKNIEMLDRHGVYTKVELASRYEILLENYNKTLGVEALTALKMAKTQIYPTAVKYLDKISESALKMSKLGVDNEFIVDDVKTLSHLVAVMKEQMKVLEEEIKYAQCCSGDVHEQAMMWKDKVFTQMNLLRETADTIETLVDEKDWPMPTYVDLLFGI